MKFFLCSALFCCCSWSAVYAIDPVAGVLARRLDSSASILSSKLEAGSTIHLTFASGTRDEELLRASYVRVMQNHNLSVADEANNTVTIVTRDVAVRYRNTEDNDSVFRDIYTSVEAIQHVNGTSYVHDISLPLLTEKCSRADALTAESTQYASTHGTMPSAPTAFWEDILQPVVYIGAAAATVILLFTVRSH